MVVVLAAVAVALWWFSARSAESAIREAVARGDLVIVGIDLSWNLQRDSVTADVHLLNTGDEVIEGELVFEIDPRTDQLSRTYIAEVLAASGPADRQQLRRSLEGSPKLKAKDRALLAYLERGETTDNPDFETIPFEAGERPDDLSFRKTTPAVKIAPDQLAKVVVTQELPRSRMGEHLPMEAIHLIGIKI
jgi:hypothetical protein